MSFFFVFPSQSLHFCSSHLEKCYNGEEIKDIKETSVTLIEKVLALMGANFDLDKCEEIKPQPQPITGSAAAATKCGGGFGGLIAALIIMLLTTTRAL